LNKRKHLLIDLDNTITDFYGEWLGTYNRLYNRSVMSSDIKTWDIHEHCPDGLDIYKILDIPGFYRKPKPFPGAVEAIERMMSVVNVRLCTAAHAGTHVASEKMWWISNHLPFVPLKDVHCSYHKEEIKADGIVDDGPHNITKYHAEWPEARIWALRWPYNEHLAGIADMYSFDHYSAESFWQALLQDVLEWSQR
jgi:5'-nucleotidase